MISQTTEYALRAVVYLAQHSADSWTTQQIADATHVPAGYLSKVLQGLSRFGIVSSQRGRHGGFQLAKPPSEFSVLEIVNAVEPIRRITKCPMDIPSHAGTLCSLHETLDEAISMIEERFAATTLEDMTHRKDVASGECVFPLIDVSIMKKTKVKKGPKRRGRRKKSEL
ncbi:MAG: transcriptional regulator [Planctomycetaceae bacterium]|nr:transcriptional regulator [Planctomycetaceae bacterium]